MTHDITEIAILVALAIILDLGPFKIKLSGGAGSISITMVPLIILALRFNFYKSFIAIGVVYGVITAIFDGYGIQYFPFDYLLGYGALSLISFFRVKHHEKLKFWRFLLIVAMIFVSGLLRIIFSTISGVIILSFTFRDAFIYNVLPIGISLIVSAIVVSITYPLIHRHMRVMTR